MTNPEQTFADDPVKLLAQMLIVLILGVGAFSGIFVITGALWQIGVSVWDRISLWRRLPYLKQRLAEKEEQEKRNARGIALDREIEKATDRHEWETVTKLQAEIKAMDGLE
jgi:hypothetical protein